MAETTIQIRNNGPILVRGGSFEVQDADGNTFPIDSGKAVALCRCGESNKKPFCDGTHSSCGFASQVKAE